MRERKEMLYNGVFVQVCKISFSQFRDVYHPLELLNSPLPYGRTVLGILVLRIIKTNNNDTEKEKD